MTTVGELGEDAVLARILPRFVSSAPGPAGLLLGPGDDAAVIAVDGGTVLTTDTMVEGPDFRLDWSTADELGAKAVGSNLADVAAMGAEPVGVLVALSVPVSTELEWIEAFADGIAGALGALAPRATVLGGDLATADRVLIAVTAVGALPPDERGVTRSGARPGDVLAVAGSLGQAGAGLALLRELGPAVARAEHPALLAAQLAPRPPIALGAAARAAGATAMLDVSDGLTRDAARIASASGVAVALDSALVARETEALARALPAHLAGYAERFVLGGGEDHALLAAFGGPPPTGFRRIGTIEHGTGVLLGGAEIAPTGWDSLRG